MPHSIPYKGIVVIGCLSSSIFIYFFFLASNTFSFHKKAELLIMCTRHWTVTHLLNLGLGSSFGICVSVIYSIILCGFGCLNFIAS